ncbi:MAG: hypothetical protein HOW73_23580 [Polyangiaceae bacterium]|nr:hypothetical protein [Polyangiaceae bacterium]
MKRLFPLLLASCATLADGAPGLDNPPSARAGPFRLVTVGELGQNRVPPYAVDDDKNRLRDASVLDSDEDPTTLEVEGYFGASVEDAPVDEPSTRIARLHAIDGRSFDRDLETVLEPDPELSWQGGRLGSPSVLFDADGVRRIYYEAAGGIGLAIDGDDGFVSNPDPVLTQADIPWATAPLGSPGVVRMEDDTYRLYFDTEIAGEPVIGFASSDDGITFRDRGPIIEMGHSESAVDAAFVGSPFPVLATSSEGRPILYVYYTAIANSGKQSIALAARFIDPEAVEDGPEPLDKSPSSMYGPAGSVQPHEPAVIRFSTFSLLFTTQKTARDADDVVVTVGVSPGNIELPPAEP